MSNFELLNLFLLSPGKNRDVGYVERIRDKLLNSINNMDDPDTDVSSTTEPVTGVSNTVMTAGDIDSSVSYFL